MITQVEKNNLILTFDELICHYGAKYAVGLKYGQCKSEQDLFVVSSYRKMLDLYTVFANDVLEAYTFEGGDITFDDGIIPISLSGTIKEVAFEIENQSVPIGMYSIIDNILYIVTYTTQPTDVTGDVTSGICPACLLDKINCITTEEMYSLYDKYYCETNCVTETNIP